MSQLAIDQNLRNNAQGTKSCSEIIDSCKDTCKEKIIAAAHSKVATVALVLLGGIGIASAIAVIALYIGIKVALVAALIVPTAALTLLIALSALTLLVVSLALGIATIREITPDPSNV